MGHSLNDRSETSIGGTEHFPKMALPLQEVTLAGKVSILFSIMITPCYSAERIGGLTTSAARPRPRTMM